MSESLRILVIEDDPSISEVVCAHLTRQGHCCVGAFSGTEGMLHLEHGDGSVAFDLVITDLMLPGMTGEDVVGRHPRGKCHAAHHRHLGPYHPRR